MPTLPALARHGRLPWAVVGGILVAALSLRAPIVAPAPVLGDIQADLGISSTVSGLLTGLPVLCFALTAPLAVRVIRRAGPDAAVLICLLGVVLGAVVRSVGPTALVIAGTVLIGAAITIGNIVVPVVIRRGVPAYRVGMVTGGYTAALNVGSMITVLGTAPLASVVGWRWALASWGLVAGVGALCWVPLVRRATRTAQESRATRAAQAAEDARTARSSQVLPGSVTGTPESGPVRTRTVGWLLMVAFCGQAFAYYAVTTWLPTLLNDERGLASTASGAIASLFQVSAVVGALGVPVLAARTPGWVPVAAVGLLWSALPVGMLLTPDAYVLWTVCGGIAQGGGFTAVFSIVARIARSDAEAATLSARVQTGGYLAATAGPPLAGALHTATGGWTAPLLVVLVATLTFGSVGVVAALRAAHPVRAHDLDV
ncbi:MAG TPA: MFS transporter [Cellulomonas sp.]